MCLVCSCGSACTQLVAHSQSSWFIYMTFAWVAIFEERLFWGKLFAELQNAKLNHEVFLLSVWRQCCFGFWTSWLFKVCDYSLIWSCFSPFLLRGKETMLWSSKTFHIILNWWDTTEVLWMWGAQWQTCYYADGVIFRTGRLIDLTGHNSWDDPDYDHP